MNPTVSSALDRLREPRGSALVLMLRTFIVAASLVAAGSLLAADVFYETRLRAGREALVAGKHVEAAENLRIACFGMLDTPGALSPCLAMLAVAQHGVGRTNDVEATLSRFVELESRYPSYAAAQLDLGIRREFEPLLRQRIPAETLASLAAFRAPQSQVSASTRPKQTPTPDVPVVPAQQIASTPQKPAVTETAPAQKPAVTGKAPAPKPATPVTQSAATTNRNEPVPAARNEVLPVPKVDPSAAKPSQTTAAATRPVTPDAKPAVTQPATPDAKTQSAPAQKPAPTTAAKTPQRPVSADPIGDARKLMSDRKPIEATRLLENAVEQSPARRDYRLALLQSAVFASDWKTALAQIEPLKPFKDSEAAYTFYGAVALYESGRRAEARALLTPVVPRLAHSTYVDNYVAKITQ